MAWTAQFVSFFFMFLCELLFPLPCFAPSSGSRSKCLEGAAMGARASRPQANLQSSTYVPMWVMSVENFLKLDHMPKHEELRRAGLLVKRSHNHFCIFVSHQWLGLEHPDPRLQQLPILQEALRNIISGRCSAQSDLASQFFGESRRLSKVELQKLQSSYIWLDWFSIPQHPTPLNLKDEHHEIVDSDPDVTPQSAAEVTHFPSLRSPSSLTDQDLYISSIPFFVEVSDTWWKDDKDNSFSTLVPFAVLFANA